MLMIICLVADCYREISTEQIFFSGRNLKSGLLVCSPAYKVLNYLITTFKSYKCKLGEGDDRVWASMMIETTAKLQLIIMMNIFNNDYCITRLQYLVLTVN